MPMVPYEGPKDVSVILPTAIDQEVVRAESAQGRVMPAQVPVAPKFSADALWLLGRIQAPHPDVGPERQFYTQELVSAAMAAIPAIEARSRPATIPEWASFLFPLVLVTKGAPDRDDSKGVRCEFAIMVRAIATALYNTPICVLTQANRATLMQEDFWPNPNRILAVLSADIRATLAERDIIRRVAAATPAVDTPHSQQSVAKRAELLETLDQLRMDREAEAKAERLAKNNSTRIPTTLRRLMAAASHDLQAFPEDSSQANCLRLAMKRYELLHRSGVELDQKV